MEPTSVGGRRVGRANTLKAEAWRAGSTGERSDSVPRALRSTGSAAVKSTIVTLSAAGSTSQQSRTPYWPIPLELAPWDLGDEVGCAPHVPPDDRQAIGGDEPDVGLHDEIELPIADDVDRRNGDSAELPWFDVSAPQACHFEHDHLMREERRRRLAQDAVRQLAAPVRFFGFVQLFVRRHRRDSSAATMASSSARVKMP